MNEIELISEHARMTLQLEEMAQREARLVDALEESAEYFEHMLRGDPAYLPVDPVKTERLIYNKIKQALTTRKEPDLIGERADNEQPGDATGGLG